jgi:pyruvate dehydrogenase E2 component (dihydrolipoamide acetyltransferase)
MPNLIEMPKLSDTMSAGTLVKWLKREGDQVKTGDMLAEVETDKATMELECFFDGTLLKILAPDGAQVAVGAPLCAIGQPGEVVDLPGGKRAPATVAATPPAPPPAVRIFTAPPAPAPAPASRPPAVLPLAPVKPAGWIKISPLARKLAAGKGVDPARLAGSGPGGRIVRADVLAAPSTGESPISDLKSQIQEERTLAVSNMRGAIARRLVESKTQQPHFYVEIEIDAAPLLGVREQINSALEVQGEKLSVNDFVLKACAEALRRVPQVNASWENPTAAEPASLGQVHYHAAAHVSFAVAIDDGLITPVIRDAHQKSLRAISTEARALAKRAKEKKLALAEFTGGTFCVSNLGMLGIPRFSAIINPPNAAILAVGAAIAKPVVRDDQIAIGQTMVLTLSCDHRVVDGAVAAQFLLALKSLLEAPAVLLL